MYIYILFSNFFLFFKRVGGYSKKGGVKKKNH